MEMADKEVSAFSFAEFSTARVIESGEVDEFEVLFGFDQGVSKAER